MLWMFNLRYLITLIFVRAKLKSSVEGFSFDYMDVLNYYAVSSFLSIAEKWMFSG